MNIIIYCSKAGVTRPNKEADYRCWDPQLLRAQREGHYVQPVRNLNLPTAYAELRRKAWSRLECEVRSPSYFRHVVSQGPACLKFHHRHLPQEPCVYLDISREKRQYDH